MDLTSDEIFFLVDNLVFLITFICLAILVVTLYKSTNNYFNSVTILAACDRDKQILEAKNEALENSILGKLEEHKLENFEMFHNGLKAHEKRIKEHIDENTKENKDAN